MNVQQRCPLCFRQCDSLDIDISAEIAAIQNKLKSAKNDDLAKNKKEIKRELKVELVSRYYLKQGVIRATILDNVEVDAALDVLKNTNRYNEILKIEE